MLRAALLALGVAALALPPPLSPVLAQSPVVPAQACRAGADLAALLAESEAAYNANQAPRGLALLQRMLEPSAAPGCEVLRGEALRRLALADAFVLRFDAAREKLTTAVALFRAAGESSREAQVLLQLGLVLVRSGRGSEAVAPLLRARDLMKAADERTGLLVAYDRLAYAMDAGPEKEALRAEALAFARLAPDGRSYECSLVHQWGDELFTAGRYNEAFTELRQAIQCFTEQSDARLGRAYVSLGRLYRAHGRLDAALEQYQRALRLQQKGTDTDARLQTLNAIAATYNYMGRNDEALARFQDALALARTTGSERAVQLLLGAVGTTYVALGRYQEAVDTLEDLLKTPNLAQAAARLTSLSGAYLYLGSPARALDAADRALALNTQSSPGDELDALQFRARALTALGRYEESSRDLERSVALIERLRVETVPDDFLKRGFAGLYQEVFAATIAMLGAEGRHTEALETAERGRARAFLDLLAARTRSASSSAVAPHAVTGAATASDMIATAARLQSTLVAFWVDSSATTVWIVRPDGVLQSRTIKVTAERLAGLVSEATGSREQGGSGLVLSSAAAMRPWRTLHQILIDPIRDLLPAPAGSRLTIIPHGPLFGLPFAALRDARDRYLIESYDLHYVPAVGVLAYTAAPRRAARVSALLVGDPGPGAAVDEALNLPPIPWANREVRAVDRLLPARAALLTGKAATESGVRDHLSGRTLLHFATHGIVRNEEGLTSYLALQPSTDGTSDGRLTADETYGLQLDAELVVLSGCRTALGPVSGDGVIGFTRAFLAAGASSVIATMWDVPDRTSYELMRGFYARWLAGAPKSQSLRRAQLAVIRALRDGRILLDGRPLPESPRLWAGFVLVGEP